jgi:hypothetical protein
MLHACHQGVHLGGRGGFEPESNSFNVYAQAEGVVVLSASSAQQMAQDHQDGWALHVLVKGLTAASGGEDLNADSNQSDVVTVHGIAAYTSAQVRDDQSKQGAGKRTQFCRRSILKAMAELLHTGSARGMQNTQNRQRL